MALLAAASRGDAAEVERLVKDGWFHRKTDKARSSLALALHASDLRIGPLVQNGASPLHLAAFKGHIETVRTLTELGANLDARNAVRAQSGPARRRALLTRGSPVHRKRRRR